MGQRLELGRAGSDCSPADDGRKEWRGRREGMGLRSVGCYCSRLAATVRVAAAVASGGDGDRERRELSDGEEIGRGGSSDGYVMTGDRRRQ